MQIRKVQIGYRPDTHKLLGLKFYSKDGAVVLETGLDWDDDDDYETNTVLLADGERIIGYKSRRNPPILT